jgi:hypothetical protein
MNSSVWHFIALLCKFALRSCTLPGRLGFTSTVIAKHLTLLSPVLPQTGSGTSLQVSLRILIVIGMISNFLSPEVSDVLSSTHSLSLTSLSSWFHWQIHLSGMGSTSGNKWHDALIRPRFHFFLLFLVGWDLSPLGTATTTNLLYQPQMTEDGDCGAIGGIKIGRGNRSTRRETCPSAT